MQNNTLPYELILLEKVLKVSLSDNMRKTGSSFSSDSLFLPGVSRSIPQYHLSSISENLTILDEILMERLSIPQTPILTYCSDSYYLTKEELGKEWSVTTENQRKILNYLLEILVSYSSLSLSEPEMFPDQFPLLQAEGIQLSSQRMLQGLEKISEEFLLKMVAYWEEQNLEFMQALFQAVLVQLWGEVRNKSLLDDPVRYTQIFRQLIFMKPVSALFLQSELIDWNWNGLQLETQSPLSPYFSPGYFPSLQSFNKIPGLPPPQDSVRDGINRQFEKLRSRGEYEKILQKMHGDEKQYVMVLVDIIKQLMKNDMKKTLNWLAAAVVFNAEKAKLGSRLERPTMRTSSSEGFCINVLDVLLQLCKPFFDPNDPKAQKIDPFYVLHDKKMAKINETPICTSLEKLPREDKNFGTITEFYFLCVQMFHYGWNQIRQNYMDLNRILNQLKGKKNPAADEEFKYFIKIKLCYDVILLDSGRNTMLLQLCNLTMNLVIKWAGFQGNLPLPPPTPILGILPEHMVENIWELLIIILELQPQSLRSMGSQEILNLLTFATIVLSSPGHFSNPYLRAKLVQALSMILEEGVFGDLHTLINLNEIAKKYLLPSLIIFYVDIEFSGSHSQFYDKFSYRHYTAKIFAFLWKFEYYQNQTKAQEGEPYFARFINMLINDTTWCYDEGLKKLMECKKLINKRNTESVTPQEEEENSRTEGYCKYMMQQANESIGLLEQVADWNSSLFVSDEFGDRIAAMLNYFLALLCGPKCLEIKVENPKYYNFLPEEMLGNIIRIYLHIGKHDKFYQCIIKDERSYSGDIMNKALRICNKRPILAYELIQSYEQFIQRVKSTSQVQQSVEDKLGEIPDEFLDPISCELMRNPVILPSGTRVDRPTIVRHLLSDQHDPFSRAPLTADELIEDTDLKERINSWINERLNS